MRESMIVRMRASVLFATTLLLSIGVAVAGALPADVTSGLESSKYAYISSTRKDGTLGKPAEIWFLYHDGAVYVGTPPKSWRVKRIKAGRPRAKIAVGKPDGPSFMATGAVVNDAKVQELMLDTFAKKYPDGWSKHADNFRSGFKDGSRVVVKYTPAG